MRTFTEKNYKQLKEQIDVIAKEIDLHEIHDLGDQKIKVSIVPTILISTGDLEEDINYAKEIWSMLLLDLYPVRYGKILGGAAYDDSLDYSVTRLNDMISVSIKSRK